MSLFSPSHYEHAHIHIRPPSSPQLRLMTRRQAGPYGAPCLFLHFSCSNYHMGFFFSLFPLSCFVFFSLVARSIMFAIVLSGLFLSREKHEQRMRMCVCVCARPRRLFDDKHDGEKSEPTSASKTS
jgi:hypothetical protein